jgi:hypothetical protein
MNLVLSQSFFLKNFVPRRPKFRPLECQIIRNFGHTSLVARSPTRLISVTSYSFEDAVYAAQVQR